MILLMLIHNRLSTTLSTHHNLNRKFTLRILHMRFFVVPFFVVFLFAVLSHFVVILQKIKALLEL